MAGSTDFVPFATAAGANVTAQATYIAESTTQTGYASGVASSADCNKVWRQATFIAAVVANFIANTLGINVPDDGNLTNCLTNFGNALSSVATTAATSVVNNAISLLTLPFAKITGTIANSQFPTAVALPGTISATAFNVSSSRTLKKNIRRIEGALDKLGRLNGVIFEWRKSGETDAGLIMQDVRRALPEAVEGIGFNPVGVIGFLVEALKEERDARCALEKRVAKLERR